MKHDHEGIPRMMQEVRDSQRNTVWPDTLRNGRSVDYLLWHGSPIARPVQRIGILILALSFFLVGTALYAIAYDQHSFSPFVVTLLTFSAGTKLTVSACRGLGSSSKSKH